MSGRLENIQFGPRERYVHMKATMSPRRKAQAAEVPAKPDSYRIGCVAKTGRVIWAYDELVALDEAQAIATRSRLKVIESAKRVGRLVQMPWLTKQRLDNLRFEKANPAEAKRRRLNRVRRAKEEQQVHAAHGRVWAVGVIGPTGKLERLVFDDLSKAEAEMVAEGTEFSIIPPGQFDAQTMQSKWNGYPRQLHMKLYKHRNAELEAKWDGRTCRGGKVARTRKLTIWILTYADGGVVDVTTDELWAGWHVDQSAANGTLVNAFRMTVELPETPTAPKPQRRKSTAD